MNYTVKSGDTLSLLAARFLGSAHRWPEIYELNKSKIQNPELIYPGQVLAIPTGANTHSPTGSISGGQSSTGTTGGGKTDAGAVGGMLPILALGGLAFLLLSN